MIKTDEIIPLAQILLSGIIKKYIVLRREYKKAVAKRKILIVALIVVVSMGLTVCPGYADKPSKKDVKTENPLTQAFKVIDQLLERYPGEQATLFKLKTMIDGVAKLSSLNVSEDRLPSASGNISAALSRTPDGAADMYSPCTGQHDESLREILKRLISCQIPVGYQGAQKIIFEELDNHEGIVTCIYTGRQLKTNSEPPATNMNIEHTWPQSQGAVGDAKCDLHHLFPTDSKANNLRGSYPFGVVSNPTWQEGGSKFDGDEFEIRKENRGNSARAMFYFAVRYDKRIPNDEEADLKKWAAEDPVDQGEKDRNNKIENYQHNRNPFVDHPEFVNAISDF